MDSWKATLAPPRTMRLPTAMSRPRPSTYLMASFWERPGATFAKIVMARSRSRRVMAWRAGCSFDVTREDNGTRSPPRVRTWSRLMSSGLDRWEAMSFSRTSMRRPPELYFPTRMPPTSALIVVATSSIETPMSAAMARSGSIRSSGIPS